MDLEEQKVATLPVAEIVKEREINFTITSPWIGDGIDCQSMIQSWSNIRVVHKRKYGGQFGAEY
jgi:hypothetical protein